MDDKTSVLPTYQVSAEDRLQRFFEDDQALSELAARAHEKAMSEDENANAAGHLDLKIRERRAQMWGYDSPVRFDMVMMTEAKKPTTFEAAEAVIRRLVEQQPAAQRVLRARLEQMSPERALELLGSPEPVEGDGAASTVPEDDGPGLDGG